jgi:hypothetical protein
MLLAPVSGVFQANSLAAALVGEPLYLIAILLMLILELPSEDFVCNYLRKV